jgi:3-hydroxyisobutyrate dehydrogenase
VRGRRQVADVGSSSGWAVSRRIGIVGLGRMGLPMCLRLRERGFAVLATDLRPELEASVSDAGAHWGASAAEVAGRCDALITMLPGPDEVSEIAPQVVETLAPGCAWIDMSSATPAVAAQISLAAEGRGVQILDAPVGGGPPQARDGRLLVFVGGSGDDLDSQRDVLDSLGDRVVHVGPAGSGYAVKLIVNMLWFEQAVAAAEALSLAVRFGLDPETVRLAVQESAAAGRFMERDAPALMSGDNYDMFSLARCHEELTGVVALGDHLEVPLALAERATELYAQALERYGDIDGELLAARLVAERAGVNFSD